MAEPKTEQVELILDGVKHLSISERPEIQGKWKVLQPAGGTVDALEVRHTILALMLSEEYVNVIGKSTYDFPVPEMTDDTYRLSRDCPLVPKRNIEEYGKVTDLVHQQADVVIDIVFETLRTKLKITAKQVLPDNFAYLPNPRKIPRLYRLSRDWADWPTLGATGQPFIDTKMARWTLMADMSFETLKVLYNTSRQGVKAARALQSGTDVDETEFDEETVAYMMDHFVDELETAATAFVSNRFARDKLCFSRGTKTSRTTAIRWREFCFAGRDDEDDLKKLMYDLDDQDLEEVYLRTCRIIEPDRGSPKTTRTKAKTKAASKAKDKGKGKARSRASEILDEISASDEDETITPRGRAASRGSQNLDEMDTDEADAPLTGSRLRPRTSRSASVAVSGNQTSEDEALAEALGINAQKTLKRGREHDAYQAGDEEVTDGRERKGPGGAKR